MLQTIHEFYLDLKSNINPGDLIEKTLTGKYKQWIKLFLDLIKLSDQAEFSLLMEV